MVSLRTLGIMSDHTVQNNIDTERDNGNIMREGREIREREVGGFGQFNDAMVSVSDIRCHV